MRHPVYVPLKRLSSYCMNAIASVLQLMAFSHINQWMMTQLPVPYNVGYRYAGTFRLSSWLITAKATFRHKGLYNVEYMSSFSAKFTCVRIDVATGYRQVIN